MRSTPRLPVGAVVAAVTVAFTFAALLSGLSAQPQFRGGVDRVTVDAIIVDKDGTPIRDLTRDDFTLEVDGKPRRVQSAELVNFDRTPAPGAGGGATVANASAANAGSATEALPEVTTNAHAVPSRLIMLMVDRESLKASDSKLIMQAGAEFVRRLDSADRVGLLAFPGQGPHIDFTRDHQRVTDALASIVGEAQDRVTGGLGVRVSMAEAFAIERSEAGALQKVGSRECNSLRDPGPCLQDIRNEARQIVTALPAITQAKLHTLQSLIEALSHFEGPKVVVLLSQGIPYGDNMPPEIGQIGAAAARAAISFYAIQAFRPTIEVSTTGKPPDLDEDRRLMAAGLANIASASGGALLQPAGKVDGAFQQIARELSARYTLSFDVEPGDQDGKPHRITLQMARASTRLLRYRREFTWRSPSTGPTNGDPQATLATLLASGDIRNELPLQISTFTMPQLQPPGQKTTVWAHLPEVGGGAGAGASVRLEVFDEKNVRLVQTSKSIDTGDFMAAMALPPGRYVARIAAQDGTGKLGSAEHAFEARVQGTSDLQVGSLMLLNEQSVDDGHPAPLHSVAAETSAFRVYVELQAASAAAWPNVKAALEVVDPADGRVRTTVPLSLRETNDATRRIAEAVVPFDGWNAGSYLTRAAFTSGGTAIATVTRTLVLDTAHAAAASTSTANAATPATDGSTGAGASVDEAVSLGSGYVQQYITQGSSIVAEEHYVQIIRRGPANAKRRNVDPDLEWRDSNWTRAKSFEDAKLRRQLISDVLMVKTNTGLWINFRDVGTVDGKEIADRSKRALDLFTKTGVDVGATLRRVAEASSRWDLGRVGNINNPTLPLLVLQAAHKARFEFRGEGTDTVDGIATVVVSYRERKTPTFIRNLQNEDVFISGKLWITPGDGRVLRTEMVEYDKFAHTTSNLIVAYRTVPELGVLMPVEMWERYTPDRPLDDYVERRARYTNFRRFTVAVSDSPSK